MKNYLQAWNFMRILRLVLGVSILIQGVQAHEILFIFMGGLFTLMPIFNVGCCSTAGCATPNKKSTASMDEISFEEVK